MNVLSLFDGMSCGNIALERAGIQVNNYYASEIDKHGIQVTQHNYPNTIQLGSIIDLDTEYIKTLDIDMIIGGSPCQGFSVSGKMKGSSTKCGKEVTTLEQYMVLKEMDFEFDGQSYLFWEYMRVLKAVEPKYFLLENVRVTKKWLPVFNEAVGVEPIMINSALVSAQKRVRYYWTNIPNIVQPDDKNISLQSVLNLYTPTSCETIRILEATKRGYIEVKDGDCFDHAVPNSKTRRGRQMSNKSNCLLTSHQFMRYENSEYRKFTPVECERLQTVPEGYTSVVSDSQRYKMLGNGWTVDVVAHIFKSIVKHKVTAREVA